MPPAIGRPRPRTGARRVLAAVLALALVAGACSDDGEGSSSTTEVPAPLVRAADREPVSEDDLGPFDVREEGLAGPGTPLGGGLTVPEGAVLLGVPFPDLIGSGYRALLLVTGDPIEVYNAFGEQAGGMGMALAGGCLGGLDRIGCGGQFVDGADGESLDVSVQRIVGPTGVVSGLGLRYRPPGSDETGEGGDGVPPGPTQPVGEVALPEGPVEPPADEDVALVLRPPDSPVRTVEVGSRLVGLPGPCACDGLAAGWSFVVEVTGVMRDVVAAYGRQFSDLGDVPDIADRRRDGVTLMGLRVGTDLRRAEIRAVEVDGGRDFVIVTVRGT